MITPLIRRERLTFTELEQVIAAGPYNVEPDPRFKYIDSHLLWRHLFHQMQDAFPGGT